MSVITCNSTCVTYPAGDMAQATIPSTAYPCTGISPLPLGVTITADFNSDTGVMVFTINVNAPGNILVVTYSYSVNDFKSGFPSGGNISGSGPGTAIYADGDSGLDDSITGSCYFSQGIGVGGSFPRPALTMLTLGAPSSQFSGVWKSGDKYVINAWSCCPTAGISIMFSRSLYSAVDTQSSGGLPTSSDPQMITAMNNSLNAHLNNNVCCNNCCGASGNICSSIIAGNCGTIRVPIVNINAQTTVDGADIGYVIFAVCDEFTYYEEQPLPPEDKCAVIYIAPNQVKQTVFRRCCPFMVSVLRGRGHTARNKAWSIWERFSVQIGVVFETFYLNLILYAMSVYVLSRLLYGNFSINYVLTKYFDKFIEDLGNSRFCEFTAVYLNCTSPVFGYNKFFRFDKRRKSLQ